MAHFSRFLQILAVSFLIFPAIHIAWLILRNPEAESWGFLGEYMLALFGQFLAPRALWLIPLGFGTMLWFAVELVIDRRKSRRGD